MRLICPLAMATTCLIFSCQSIRFHRLIKQHPYDTLDRYSYLLVITGLKSPRDTNIVTLSHGTGFFYKNDSARLFLVTAYHVLTGCDMYPVHKKVKRDTSVYLYVDVWYHDGANRFKSQRLSLAGHKPKTCPTAAGIPDLDTMDVSSYFKDTHINSVERMIWDSSEAHTMALNDTVVCHGFSNLGTYLTAYDSNYLPRKPRAHMRRAVDTASDPKDTAYTYWYHFVTPSLKRGVSGAPLFRVRTDAEGNKVVEFVGLQSASRKHPRRSVVVKESMVKDRFID